MGHLTDPRSSWPGRGAPLLAGLLLSAGCAGAPAVPETAASAAAHWSSVPPAGGLQVALLYHALAGSQPPPELALAWPDVCEVRGEAEQAVAVRKAAPRLAEAAAATTPERHWQVQLRQELGPWDAVRGGFRTVIRTGAVVRFAPPDFCFAHLQYLMVFTNGDRFSMLALAPAAAARLVQADPRRAVTYDLEVAAVGHQLEAGVPVLQVSVVRLRAHDATGAVLSDVGPSTRR